MRRILIWTALAGAAVIALIACGSPRTVVVSPAATPSPTATTSTPTPAPSVTTVIQAPAPAATTVIQAPAPVAPPAPAAAEPASVVEEYYAAINSGNYRQAYDLGGYHFAASYDAFAADYADTAEADLTIEGVTGNLVSVSLVATQTDGSTRTFAGTYTVSGDSLVGASIQRTS